MDSILRHLNKDQTAIFNSVMESLDRRKAHKDGRMFFVEGSAGTGKSFLLYSIKIYAASKGHSVATAASTGVAAALLGGVTAHSLFGLSRERPPYGSRIDEETDRAKRLQLADLFIWDEISMSQTSHLTKADDLLRSLTGVNIPFGGKVVVFAGDMRGLLPPARGPSECAFFWRHWPLVQKYLLTKNMRIVPAHSEYAEEILQIGTPSPSAQPYAQIDSKMIVDSLDKLITKTFAGCFDGVSQRETFGRVILTLKNDISLELSDAILKSLHQNKPVKYLYSFTESSSNANQEQSTLEGLTPSGCPPHRLLLKIGADVMLLRNVDTDIGLSNGTVPTVAGITGDNLTCTIRNGPFAGTTANIPRVRAYYQQGSHAFFRTQFPVCLRYATTIHKAQGQTFDRVGVYLDDSVFAHGQLYTALSRVRSKRDVLISLGPRVQPKIADNPNKLSIENVQECVFKKALH